MMVPPALLARAARCAIAVAIGAALLFWAWGIWPPFWIALACVVAIAVARVCLYSGTWAGWFRIKFREWAADIRQLGLWARLAFKPRRDALDTATMAHQHQFLMGRVMSPMNIFTVLPLILALGGTAYGAFSGWRVERLKDQRDAPCSARELTQDDNGDFRTTRASCAQLGATNQVAAQWRERATEIEREHNQTVAQIREETAAEIARQQRAAQRRMAVTAQQRRRNNEGIEAALGGQPPDLERSLCELAGRVDCGPTGGADQSAPAPAAGALPSAN